jgi:hypothetical protein
MFSNPTTPTERRELRRRADARYHAECARVARIHDDARAASSVAECNRLHAFGDAEYARALHALTVGDETTFLADLAAIRRGVRV